jgi:hypothetical protein
MGSTESRPTGLFSALTGVRSMNEIYPVEKVAEAHAWMEIRKARFRVVLTTRNWMVSESMKTFGLGPNHFNETEG